MHQLKEAFDQGDRTAFTRLCAVQQELRDITLYEAKGAQVCARCQWAEERDILFLFLEPGLQTSCPADDVLDTRPCNWSGPPRPI